MSNSLPSNNTEDLLWILEIPLMHEEAGIVEEILAVHEQAYALWEDRKSGAVMLRIYCETPAEADATEKNLSAWLRSWTAPRLRKTPPVVRCTLLKEDWSESWKKHFRSEKISGRVTIKPTWEEHQPDGGGIVLEIDPGMSFGTGRHGTTKACIQFLDELSVELGQVSLLDAGCGSGILSLTAWKLGFAPVYAFDHDLAAVTVAREHLAGADPETVIVTQGDLENYRPPEPCRIVVANILANILEKNAEQLVSFLAKGGEPAYLILSGILDKQYSSICKHFQALGVTEVSTRLIDEWKTGLFTT